MFNKFNSTMKKAYKAYNLTTPAQKRAFCSFCADACLELAGSGKGILPDRTIMDEAAAYAHHVHLAEEEISLAISVGAEPYHGDQLMVANEWRPNLPVETSWSWIDWEGLRK